MPSPLCTVQDDVGTPQVTPPFATVTPGNTVTIALVNAAGVNVWDVTCIGTDETTTPATVNAGLSVNALSKTATFTAPSAGTSLIFQSKINGGQANGITRTDYVTTFKVATLVNGNAVGATSETFEHNATFGWTALVNQAIRSSGGAALASSTPAVLVYGTSGAVGVGTTAARDDHTHTLDLSAFLKGYTTAYTGSTAHLRLDTNGNFIIADGTIATVAGTASYTDPARLLIKHAQVPIRAHNPTDTETYFVVTDNVGEKAAFGVQSTGQSIWDSKGNEFWVRTNTTSHPITASLTANLQLCASASPTSDAPTYGGGQGVVALYNAGTEPSSSPTSRALLFAHGGDLYRYTSNGMYQSLGLTLVAQTWPSDANYTAPTGVYRATHIQLSGATLTAARNFVLPNRGSWWIYNGTGGGFAIVAKTSAGTGVTIPNGTWMHCVADGTNVVLASSLVAAAGGIVALNNAMAVSAINVAGTSTIGLLKIDANNDAIIGSDSIGGRAMVRGNLSTNIGNATDYSCVAVSSGLVELSSFANYIVRHGTQGFDVATKTLTIRSMAPFASATGTNRTPGDLILDTPAPTNSGTTYAVTSLRCINQEIIGVTKDSAGNNQINMNPPTATTVGAAGTASNLPAKPTGYMIIMLNGVSKKIAYYDL